MPRVFESIDHYGTNISYKIVGGRLLYRPEGQDEWHSLSPEVFSMSELKAIAQCVDHANEDELIDTDKEQAR